jgi:hypothetical protein
VASTFVMAGQTSRFYFVSHPRDGEPTGPVLGGLRVTPLGGLYSLPDDTTSRYYLLRGDKGIPFGRFVLSGAATPLAAHALRPGWTIETLPPKAEGDRVFASILGELAKVPSQLPFPTNDEIAEGVILRVSQRRNLLKDIAAAQNVPPTDGAPASIQIQFTFLDV